MAAVFGVEPTERMLWALALVGVLGLLGAVMPVLGLGAPFALGGVLAAFVVDALLAGSPAALHVRRALPETAVQGVAFPLVRALRASSSMDVELTDALPPRAQALGSALERQASARLAPSREQTLTEQVTFVARGPQTFGRLTVRARGPLGLARRRARHVLDDTVRVLPDVARIGARAERLLRGRDPDGSARRRVFTEGRELESLREYQRGDDPRLIEWKRSAQAGELIVRRLQPETHQDVVVMLDVGRQFAGRHAARDGGEPRLDAALTAALTLAAAALSRGDRVGLCAFADAVRAWVEPRAGKGHLRRLADAVTDEQALAEEPDYGGAARFLLTRQKKRAMVVVVTDVLDEHGARALTGALGVLRKRHVPVVVALSDPSFARLAHAEDADQAQRTAATRILEHRRRALSALRAARAHVVDVPAPKAAALAVDAYVAAKARV